MIILGIQALDLVGRKIFAKGENMKSMKDHVKRLKEFASKRMFENSSIGRHSRTLYSKAVQLEFMTMVIGYRALKQSRDYVGVVSVDYLMYVGHVTLAEHWLLMEIKASEKIAQGKGNKDYFDAQIQTADFVFQHLLPRTLALRSSILFPSAACTNSHGMKTHQFSFDHAL